MRAILDAIAEWFRKPQVTSVDPVQEMMDWYADHIHDDVPGAESYERRRRWLEAQEFRS